MAPPPNAEQAPANASPGCENVQDKLARTYDRMSPQPWWLHSRAQALYAWFSLLDPAHTWLDSNVTAGSQPSEEADIALVMEACHCTREKVCNLFAV